MASITRRGLLIGTLSGLAGYGLARLQQYACGGRAHKTPRTTDELMTGKDCRARLEGEIKAACANQPTTPIKMASIFRFGHCTIDPNVAKQKETVELKMDLFMVVNNQQIVKVADLPKDFKIAIGDSMVIEPKDITAVTKDGKLIVKITIPEGEKPGEKKIKVTFDGQTYEKDETVFTVEAFEEVKVETPAVRQPTVRRTDPPRVRPMEPVMSTPPRDTGKNPFEL